MEYLLAHDLGTSGDKVSLYSVTGVLVRSVTIAYPTHYFNQNWVEQNAEDWWDAVCRGTKEVLGGISNQNILGISFSGQMQGCVCVDRQGAVLRPAIIWADRRAAKENARILQQISMENFYHITGHRASQSYTMQKFMWLKENEPDLYKKTYKVLNCKDYIILKLTGQFVTDYSDASGTNMLNLNHLEWSDELLEYSGIEKEKLPVILQSSDISGYVTKAAAVQTGLLAGTAVVTGGGDGVCAAVGAGCVHSGDTYSCLGTSAWIAATTRKPIYDVKMRTFNFAHMIPGYISPCGTMQAAGACYDWMRNVISHIGHCQNKNLHQLIEACIEQSPAGAKGLVFLPYLIGERSPRWNAEAKGCMFGLTLDHDYEDMVRAVLEGVAYNLGAIMDCFRDQIPVSNVRVIGGGAKNKAWLQIMADIYGIPLQRLNMMEESTSLGAAVAAGVGMGVYKDYEAAAKLVYQTEEIRPKPEQKEVYCQGKLIFDMLYDSLVPVYSSLESGERKNNEVIHR